MPAWFNPKRKARMAQRSDVPQTRGRIPTIKPRVTVSASLRGDIPRRRAFLTLALNLPSFMILPIRPHSEVHRLFLPVEDGAVDIFCRDLPFLCEGPGFLPHRPDSLRFREKSENAVEKVLSAPRPNDNPGFPISHQLLWPS